MNRNQSLRGSYFNKTTILAIFIYLLNTGSASASSFPKKYEGEGVIHFTENSQSTHQVKFSVKSIVNDRDKKIYYGFAYFDPPVGREREVNAWVVFDHFSKNKKKYLNIRVEFSFEIEESDSSRIFEHRKNPWIVEGNTPGKEPTYKGIIDYVENEDGGQLYDRGTFEVKLKPTM